MLRAVVCEYTVERRCRHIKRFEFATCANLGWRTVSRSISKSENLFQKPERRKYEKSQKESSFTVGLGDDAVTCAD
ncbi:MAG: hypothetical protein FWE90_14190, partial [Defluviitaleaceae bacterium]|nr:hypothetical protein [Defluviitaleaceae bacterium]